MGKIRFAVALALCGACVRETRPGAERIFISGKAYQCGDEDPLKMMEPASGRTLRLFAGHQLLAEDLVGPDGSFVLHPKEDRLISGRLFIEAGDKEITLSNDYASWLQEHGHYHGTLRFGCRDAPMPGVVMPPPKKAEPEEAEIPNRPLPQNLTPHY